MKPGLMSYADIGGGVALTRKETIDRCIQSYVGKPLVIKHSAIDPHTHAVVGRPTPDNMEQVAVGYIASVSLEPDGWYWAHGICFNDEGKDCIKKGWKVSHTFSNPKRGPGGTDGGIAYTHEWTNFTGEHLALVENPRYEEAEIVLHSKADTKSGARMFKLFRSKKATEAQSAAEKAAADKLAADKAAEQKRQEEAAAVEHAGEEVTELSADTLVEVGEGKTAKLSDLITKYNEPAVDHSAIAPEDEIEVEAIGKVALADLTACYALHGKKYQASKATDHSKPKTVRVAGHFDDLKNAEAIAHSKRLAGTTKTPNDRESNRARAAERFKGLPSYISRN